MKKIRVLLIEDNRLLRDEISAMLKKQKDMNVVAAIDNLENIAQKLGDLNPDIIVLELGLRIQDSIQVTKLIKGLFGKIKIIVIDINPLQADLFEYVKAGVSGFVLKDAGINEFIKAIRKVNEGFKVLPSGLTGSLFSQIVSKTMLVPKTSEIGDVVNMTKREKQVIELIADGLSNKEIAQKLNLSMYTVKSHVHNILEKLALQSRVEIAKYTQLLASDKVNRDTKFLK